MTFNSIWEQCIAEGVRFELKEEKLRVGIPPEVVLGDDLLEGIKKYKQEIIQLLLKSNENQSSDLPIVQIDRDKRFQPFPLTEMQQAYWVGRRNDMDYGEVSTHGYFEIDVTRLNLKKLNEAWNKMIVRHDMLRSVVLDTGEIKAIYSPPKYTIIEEDFTQYSSEKKKEYMGKIREEMSHQLFNLSQWPLFDIRVSKKSNTISRLHMSIDATLIDYWSIQLIFKEFVNIYLKPNLQYAPLKLLFRDYVNTIINLQTEPVYKESLEYWKSQIPELPPSPPLPTIAKEIKTKGFFYSLHKNIDSEEWNKVTSVAASLGITPVVVLLTAYGKVLSKWSNEKKFTINVPLFNRLALHPEAYQVAGNFSSFTLVSFNLLEHQDFIDLAKSIQKQLHKGIQYSNVSGVRILREINQFSGEIKFGSMPIIFTNVPNSAGGDSSFNTILEQLGNVAYSITQTPQVWLDNQVDFGKDGINLRWDVLSGIFPKGMIEDMFNSYTKFIKSLATYQWSQLGSLKLPKQQQGVFNELDKGNAKIINQLIYEDFEKQVIKTPDSIAIISSKRSITYEKLLHKSNGIAQKILSLKIERNIPIGILLPKGENQIICALGIVRAGYAYLPIDIELPKDRINIVVKDSQLTCLFMEETKTENISFLKNISVVDVNSVASEENFVHNYKINPRDMAAIIYTSGSTGKPKGVMLHHQGIYNAIHETNNKFLISSKDTVLSLTPFAHDMSIYDIFGLLSVGGSIVVPESNNRKNPKHWLNLIKKHNITLWNSVPAMMEMLMEFMNGIEKQSLDSLRLVFIGGDWIRPKLPLEIEKYSKNVKIVSVGGPTETTLWNIWHEIKKEDTEGVSIPYGLPIKNNGYYIFDRNLEPVPFWVKGQLYGRGVGVSLGYFNDKELTQKKYIEHPATKERIFATGDYAYYRSDGIIVFKGREDFQIQINGRRIELQEIEKTLEDFEKVEASVVTVSEKLISAFIVKKESQESQEPYDYEKLGVDVSDDKHIIRDVGERIQFKLNQRGLEPTHQNEKIIKLSSLHKKKNNYLKRQSHRNFLTEKVSLNDFSILLGELSQIQIKNLPKYLYPSGGGLYGVQTYLYIKEDTIESIEGGYYYYHPLKHQLILREKEMLTNHIERHSPANRRLFQNAAFSLFFVLKKEAVTPIYGKGAFIHHNGLIESGYMGQLLMEKSYEVQVGLCPIGGIDFEDYKKSFLLDDAYQLVHSMVGGKISLKQTKQWLEASSADSKNSDETILKKYLASKLPTYMIPNQYIFIPKLPLTRNGKIDYKKLNEYDLKKEFIIPKTETEKKVTNILKKMVKQDISMKDNFFELGGDSIQAIQFINEIKKQIGVEFQLSSLFSNPIVQDVCDDIEILITLKGISKFEVASNKETEEGYI